MKNKIYVLLKFIIKSSLHFKILSYSYSLILLYFSCLVLQKYCILVAYRYKCVGRQSSVGIATRYGLDGPRSNAGGRARFSAPVQTDPGAHPASCTMGTGSFPGVKRPGRGADHPPPSKYRGKERVGLYLYSPSGPSWPVMGAPIPLQICLHSGPSKFPCRALVTTERLRVNVTFESIIALWVVTPSFRRYILPPSSEFTELHPSRRRSDWGGAEGGLDQYLSPPPLPWFPLDTFLAKHLTYTTNILLSIFICRESHMPLKYNSAVNHKVHRYRSQTNCILHSSRVASRSRFCLISALRHTPVTKRASHPMTEGCTFSLQFYN